MRFLPMGDRGLLVELADLDRTVALYRALHAQAPPGIIEIIPAARTVLVLYEPTQLPATALREHVRAAGRQTADGAHGAAWADGAQPLVEIPVHYEGEDLESAAAQLGLSRAELVERHTGAEFTAAFAGFAPGFIYLAGGDPQLHDMPRHASPRTRVPAGSVAMAGDFSAVYPSDSPGGWQLLGVTPLRMWDLGRPQPALVQPGFRVRFVDLAARQRSVQLPAGPLAHPGGVAGGAATSARVPVADVALDLGRDSAAAAAPSVGIRPAPGDAMAAQSAAVPLAVGPSAGAMSVITPGLQTLVQDLGRPGLAAMGVSRSGAADRAALRAANRLVGNPVDTPALENLLGGLVLRCDGPAVVAITGAPAELRVCDKNGRAVPAAWGTPVALDAGDTLRLGAVRSGLRCYVAVRGGWDVPAVLDSRATDTLARLGPPPLQAGDTLAYGGLPASRLAAVDPGPCPAGPMPAAGELIELDIIPGPRLDWFDADALALLVGQEWTVTPRSDRIGMRLEGAQPLCRRLAGELPSEAVVPGAIQVPASGQPLVFLPDHPLTGGYPVIAVLASHELDRAGQIPAGVRLRFRSLPSLENLS